MPRSNSVNHPTREADKPAPVRETTDLFQTTDRDFTDDQEEYPIGMPKGDNSTHNVNTVVQPSITVQAAVRRLKATEK